MFVISDTNILSSFSAAKALHLLLHLFPEVVMYIPPAVESELQAGVNRGITHLNAIVEAIAAQQIQILKLSAEERQSLQFFPKKLNMGEREAIILAKNRQSPLLSNDKRAIHYYCQQQDVEVIDLPELLRSLWLENIVSRSQVRRLLKQMADVENLRLSQTDYDKVFAVRRQRFSIVNAPPR